MKQMSEPLVQSWLPTRAKDVYKAQISHVLCIGASRQMDGAIILATSASFLA